MGSLVGKFVAPFVGSGFHVLALDARNHGNSENSKWPRSIGAYESLDIVAALDFVAKRGDGDFDVPKEIKHIILAGESVGAATVLHALALRELDPAKSDNTYARLEASGFSLEYAVVDSPPNSLKDVVHNYRLPTFVQWVFWNPLLSLFQWVCPNGFLLTDLNSSRAIETA